MYKVRQKRAYEALRKAGFEKAIVGQPMTILYLTGVSVVPFERYYGLTIDAMKEELKMVVPALDSGCMEGNVEEYTYLDSEGPEEAIRKTVGCCQKLAVEKGYFTMKIGDIFQRIGCEIEDIGECISNLRAKKDEEEAKKLQRATAITAEALEYLKSIVKPGMTEKEIHRKLFAYLSEIPGVDMSEDVSLVQGGANSANPHGFAGDYAIQKGDIVLFDFGACYENYWSDITRCMFMGSVPEKLGEIYQIVLNANMEAIAKVRPGVKAKEIDLAARKVIEDAGYGEYFLHRTGHGLGISVHEEPYITSENELVLEEGMTFTIEPGIYLQGIGGVRIEDDILVTADGCEVLTKASKKLEDYIIPCE